jgi:predicted enzyme related to lactoylglutathione lyase
LNSPRSVIRASPGRLPSRHIREATRTRYYAQYHQICVPQERTTKTALTTPNGGTARVLLDPPPGRPVMFGIQVRDIHAGHARLAAAGVPVVREPAGEPWGLIEMQFEDPDGIRIVLAEALPVTLSAVTRDRRYR